MLSEAKQQHKTWHQHDAAADAQQTAQHADGNSKQKQCAECHGFDLGVRRTLRQNLLSRLLTYFEIEIIMMTSRGVVKSAQKILETLVGTIAAVRTVVVTKKIGYAQSAEKTAGRV